VAASTGGWRLGLAGGGSLEDVAPVGWSAELGAQELLVEVRAAGVNFRDVLNALGMYPGNAGPLGGEGAGVVVKVGSGVRGIAPGSRVMGVFGGAFGSRAVVDERLVVPMPAGWSFARAASVPLAFLTAWYGLVELGGLRAGESVLVHAAAGGVGMAAVQVARLVGAEVFATASPGKWEVLRAAGIDDAHIASSRDAGFEEKFRRVSGGRGVDMVLDALAGELVDAGLRLLTRGGRFVEMGKTDIRDAAVVAERFGVSYQAFDLLDADPERLHELLDKLLGSLTSGELTTLPARVWDVRQAREAFRFVSQARHVGKVVLTIPREWDPDGWIVITGGTGVLGGLVARRLAEQGARRAAFAVPPRPGRAWCQRTARRVA
jgi:NADPH:quinone reductase-like Zn-dependent oxidoreductase